MPNLAHWLMHHQLNITSLLLDHMDFLDQFIWPLLKLCPYSISFIPSLRSLSKKILFRNELFSLLLNRCIWKYFFTHNTSYFHMQKWYPNEHLLNLWTKGEHFQLPLCARTSDIGPKLKLQFDLYFHLMMDFGNVIMINMGRKCALNN